MKKHFEPRLIIAQKRYKKDFEENWDKNDSSAFKKYFFWSSLLTCTWFESCCFAFDGMYNSLVCKCIDLLGVLKVCLSLNLDEEDRVLKVYVNGRCERHSRKTRITILGVPYLKAEVVRL